MLTRFEFTVVPDPPPPSKPLPPIPGEEKKPATPPRNQQLQPPALPPSRSAAVIKPIVRKPDVSNYLVKSLLPQLFEKEFSCYVSFG